MKFAEKIKELRKEKGLSQEEVAKAIGISTRAYRSYEQEGSYPRKHDIYTKLARVFDCDPNYLRTEDEQFLTDVSIKYGSRGRRQAQRLVEDASALFAGGELSDEDKEAMLRAIQEAYWISKDEARKKFTRKDYREKNDD